MTRSILFVLGLALIAVPASAQVGGGINQDAPTASSSVKFAGGTGITVTHAAINFGQGRWQSIKENTADYAAFNERAAANPMGSVKSTLAMQVSGREIPAGDYHLFFTLDERAGWLVNLQDKKAEDAAAIRWRLVTKETDATQQRMKITVEPAEKSNEAVFTIAFGNEVMAITLSPAPAKKSGDDRSGNGR